MSKDFKEVKTEVLIIGSEAAGAKAAIEAQEADADVLVVTKGLVGKSGNTIMAGSGVQAPLGHMDSRDSPEVFLEDVVKGGAFLNNQKLVERLVNLSVTEVPKMEKWGAKFMKRGDHFVQTQLPGSSYPRTLHSISLHGGLQWRHAFKSELKRLETKILEDVFVTTLLLTDGQVAGALGISLRDGQFILFRSKITILATGGCSQVYRRSDGSRDATGDGMVLAFDAGAELMDMEFQQFFPLCCYTPPFEMSMLTANLHYFLHGKYYNALGEAFMERYLPLAKEWGLRDLTSRAIYLENKSGRGSPHGGAYIAVNHLPENLIDEWIKRDKPVYMPKLEKAGIDIRRHALECGPGAHYSMGGVRVDENCRTTVPRLYAAGEVASGMDGAERIDGGPAITWCLTMGFIAGREAANKARDLSWLNVPMEQVEREQNRIKTFSSRRKGIKGFKVKEKVKEIMWEHCALIKDRDGLEKGLSSILHIRGQDLPNLCVESPYKEFNQGMVELLEGIHLVTIAEMIIRAALMREESRQAHYRTDFPGRNDKNWLKNIIIKREKGEMAFSTDVPTMTKMWPDTERKTE